VLPVQVTEDFLQKIFEQDAQSSLTVDLSAQTITIDATGESERFGINQYKKTCLLNGYDDIDFLVSIREEIAAFEQQMN